MYRDFVPLEFKSAAVFLINDESSMAYFSRQPFQLESVKASLHSPG